MFPLPQRLQAEKQIGATAEPYDDESTMSRWLNDKSVELVAFNYCSMGQTMAIV